MSEISRFYGLIIRMFYDEHPPPHFHVQYGEHSAQIEIERLTVMRGYLPPRALGLAIEWASSHRRELLDRWHAAENQQRLLKVEPLP